ncbi:beta strand repeat-containing protein [Prosthecobacter sp.]|uniref:beta strand repeat-containing protein n=1 Tax=Prosthecobacter sp. TaxID=1965333 RepID=UPI003784D2F3
MKRPFASPQLPSLHSLALLLAGFILMPLSTQAQNLANSTFESGLTGWTLTTPGSSTITTAGGTVKLPDGTAVSDYGTIPDGIKVAVITFTPSLGQVPKLSTLITGLVAGGRYRVGYFVNTTSESLVTASLQVVQGATPLGSNAITLVKVGAGTAYNRIDCSFTATSDTHTLEISAGGVTSAPVTVFADLVNIVRMDVTNAFDSGIGSLRQGLAEAALSPGPDVIHFDPALSGQSIHLQSSIVINDKADVTVDASGLAAGITIDDGGHSTYGLFRLMLGTLGVTFRGITFADGGDATAGNTSIGGAINSASTALTLDSCTFTRNQAYRGGGIGHILGALTLTNCTFANNSAALGGAIWCGTLAGASGTARLIHCTLSQNGADTGGGLCSDHLNVELVNSIVADNDASSGADICLYGSATILTYTGANLVIDLANTDNGPIIGSSKLSAADHFSLQPLADNGGPTQTMLPFAGSMAIDAAEGSTLATDQRGFPRSRQGTGNGTGTSDSGAVEVQSATAGIVVTTTADEDDPTGTPGTGLSLREALREVPTGGVIGFDPALSGAVLTLTRGLDLTFGRSATVDASALAAVPTISGGSGTNRIFTIPLGKTVRLVALKLTGGHGYGSNDAVITVDGGAIANFGTLTLEKCTVESATCSRHGGAIYNEGTLSLLQCSLGLSHSAALGGAICNQGPLTMDKCTLSVCDAGSNGGAIYNANTLTLTNCLLVSNSAVLHGGAIESQAGTATLTNCTLTANRSASGFVIGSTATGDGGAIHNSASLTLTHCTLTANRTGLISGQGGEGGAIALNGGSLTLANSIVAENTSINSPDLYLPATAGGTLTASGSNLIGKNTTVTAAFPAGPLVGTAGSPVLAKLGALASYGGPTQTMPPLPGSLAIDAASGSTTTTDQRGYSRPQDGDGNGLASPDLGAAERSAAALFIITSTADSGPGSLRSILTAVPQEVSAPITFAASFTTSYIGSVILSTPVVIPAGISATLDASSIPGGLTLSGGGVTSIFTVSSGASLSLTGITLTGARGGPGAAIYNQGTVALTRCTLSGNSAGTNSFGGAVCSTGSLSLTQCTLSGNSATYGGAIFIQNDTAVLTQCTLSGNSADSSGGFGGAICVNAGTLTLAGCIVAGNQAPTGPDIYSLPGSSVVTATGQNLIGSNDTVSATFPVSALVGTTASPVAAGLSPLGSYGGATQTMLPLAGSPARNPAGGATTSAFSTDQRGSPRVYGAAVDLGAVEVGVTVTSTASSGAGSLRQALLDAPAGMIINVDPALSGTTITLLSADGSLTLSKSVELNATGLSSGLTLDGGSQNFRLFAISSGTTVTMNNLKLTNGGGSSFASFGAAITNAGVLSLTRCEFSGNIAGAGQSGGAISTSGSGSSLTLTECTLKNNAADFGGAIVSASSSTTTLHRCTLNNNSARNGNGGALCITAATAVLNQCTVAQNTSAATSQSQSLGGGIVLVSGSLTLNACTIAGNSISASGHQAYGGGVFYDGSLSIANTIITGNTVTGATTGGPDLFDNHDVNFSWTGSVFIGNLANSGFTTGGNVRTGNAMLSALASNGGPTQTMLPQAGSPVLDFATTTVNFGTAMGSFVTDQRGAQRLLDGDANGSLLSDLGAVEYAPARNLIVSNTGDSGPGSLRQAILDLGFSGGQDTITFSPSLNGKVILISSGEITIPAKSVTLDASALTNGLALFGTSYNRIFTVPSSGSLTLRSLILANNVSTPYGAGPQAPGYGGAIYNNGLLTLEYCSFVLSAAGTAGGAIANENGTLTALQCTFAKNLTLGNGGALACLSGTATLTHCTIAGNAAYGPVSQGGGLYRSGGTLTLTNCLVSDNGASSSATNNISGSITTTGANFVPAGTGGTFSGPAPISTGVAAFASFTGIGMLTTQLGSVAIDAAATLSPAITRDQLGQAIVGTPDLGAYELPYAPTLSVTTLADENDPVGTVGTGRSLREALRDLPAGSTLTVNLDPSFSGSTLTLTAGEIAVTKSLILDGSSLPAGITFSGGGASRIFTVSAGRSLTLRAVTLANGSATGSGGAISNLGALALERCTLSGNHASAAGGAISNVTAGATLSARQCTFAGNSCATTTTGGGAVAITSTATATFTHCTLYGNDSPGTGSSGGGLYVGSASPTTLTNCIVAGNTCSSASQANASGPITASGANFVPAGTGGTFTGTTPISTGVAGLAPLAGNGGPTQTMAVLLGSVAIDAATAVVPPITTDQRGIAIVGTPDLGAYDLDYSHIAVSILADENDPVGTLGTGLSLREALRDAPAGSTITFAPSLSGGTLALTGGEIVMTKNMTLDGSSVVPGVTLSGSNASRILSVGSGRSLTVRGLTFTRGNAVGAANLNSGGAILNSGTLTAERCTFTGNQVLNAGAGIHNQGGTLTVTQCTFSNNTAPGGGGAVSTFVAVQATLTHCTLSGNSGSFGGGGLYNFNGPLKLTNCIVAGNTSSGNSGADIRNEGNATAIVTRTGQNIVQTHVNFGGSDTGPVISAAPLLAPLATHGGSTQTMALLEGSPARDAAPVISPAITSDQRGSSIFGSLPDIGAYEGQIAALANITVYEGITIAPVSFAVGGIGTLSVTSSNTALVSNTSLSGAGGTRSLTITPTLAQSGSTTITVTDGTNGETRVFTLLINAFPAITVSSTSDSGAGSLRQALLDAASHAGPDTISLPAGFSGAVTLSSHIMVSDPQGVTIDATAIPGGLTVQGGGAAGSNRLFYVAAGSSLTLRRVVLTQGGGSNFTESGAAVYCAGALSLFECTLSGNAAPLAAAGGVYLFGTATLTATNSTFSNNSAEGGGALNVFPGCTAQLTRCTLSGNTAATYLTPGGVYAVGVGGAIANSGSLTLTHCTVAANKALPLMSGGSYVGGNGGGIFNAGLLTLEDTIIAANTSSPVAGADIECSATVSSTITRIGLNIVQAPVIGAYASAGAGVMMMADPLLSPLASNGGVTQTMMPKFGSPAINSAGTGITTADQRGCLIVSSADIGAVEVSIINPSPDQNAPSARLPEFAWTGPAGASFQVYLGTVSGSLTAIGSPTTLSALTSPLPCTRGTTCLWRVDATVNGVTFRGPEHAFIPAAPVVTNGASTGTGTLSQAFADAASAEYPGADTITFSASFTGTVSVSSEISFADSGGVTLDGSSTSTPVIIDGVTNTNRILNLSTGSRLTLKNLTFTRGGGVSSINTGNGGAIYNLGTLIVTGCTFTKNTAVNLGGAFVNGAAGDATFTSCTFYDNQQTAGGGSGGGVLNCASTATRLTLIHCTLTGNTAAGSAGGGAIRNRLTPAAFTIANCIIAGNTITGSGATGTDINNTNTINFVGVNLIPTAVAGTLDTSQGSINTAAPQLAPFGSYGGPTKTIALLPASPARNAAAVLSPAITQDQRGFPLVGQPDIGAYENGTAGSFASFIVDATGAAPNATADADHDGNPDLLEYATRGNTDVWNGNPVEKPQPINQVGQVASVEFAFPYRAAARDIIYVVSRSGDLLNWAEIYRLDMRTLQPTRANGIASQEDPLLQTINVNDPYFIPMHTFYKLSILQP